MATSSEHLMPEPGPDWPRLQHAYGAAADVPALLDRASQDIRGGHDPHSAWFALWSALCHQGDVYSASYAAAPPIVTVAESLRGSPHQFDPLFLTGCIELARLEGRGPEVPHALRQSYESAIARAAVLTDEAIQDPHYDDYPDFREALQAGLLALQGDAVAARRLLDSDLDGAV